MNFNSGYSLSYFGGWLGRLIRVAGEYLPAALGNKIRGLPSHGELKTSPSQLLSDPSGSSSRTASATPRIAVKAPTRPTAARR